MKNNVGYIEVPKEDIWKCSGGNAYRQFLYRVLSDNYDVEPMGAVLNEGNKAIQGIKLICKLCFLKGNKDIWIREFVSTATLPFDRTTGKNILLIHHIDSGFTKYPLLSKLLEQQFYRGLSGIDAVVTVSKYWQSYFIDRGHKDVRIIYNPFNVGEFEFAEDEISDFKCRYHLKTKPIVYIGNCQEAKGVAEAYRELKSLPVTLITSGKKKVDIPVVNLDLEYRDYLRLLKASSVVVAMSKFNEGWNRTVHEAMLCKTPVIGSGKGGMGELLEGGKQIICRDFDELRNQVTFALGHPELGENGYEFAKNFTIERFESEWIELINRMP